MWTCPKCGRTFAREGQDHYCGKVETVDQYIAEQDEAVRPYLNELRRILREGAEHHSFRRVEKAPGPVPGRGGDGGIRRQAEGL